MTLPSDSPASVSASISNNLTGSVVTNKMSKLVVVTAVYRYAAVALNRPSYIHVYTESRFIVGLFNTNAITCIQTLCPVSLTVWVL